jgi:hypothetical protein
MLRAIAVAIGTAAAANEFGLGPETLEISTATAGAAIERNPRTATAEELTGEPEKNWANSRWMISPRRWLAST